MKFSIIIPNLNGAKLLPTCLRSIKNQEIILIDNGSIDHSIAIAKKIYPQIKVIKNKTNRGFAAAINQGILAATNPYVVVCNNDIIIHKNYFSLISQAIKKYPQIAAFVGTTLNKTGDRIESTGLKFDYSGKCLNSRTKKTKPQFIWGGNAGLIVYRKKNFQNLGGFDPKFFAYLEDVDLSLRLHNSDYKTLWIPQALSYHLGGATSQKLGNLRHQKTVQNWFYIIIKNYSLGQIIQNLPGIIEQRLRNLSGLLKHTSFYLWLPTLIFVYGQVIINLPSMIHSRYQIKKFKKNKLYEGTIF